ncbi:MFS transporter [Bradyrhizobium sp. LHD-71]|uniref:MFS transporter n=1 Tax=Bradyrhizobium sp. LHD-71 TaxID=3072141 RepID=UPI00281003B8|nr:MFS transporter [Bradyrhizobium sp. LHD-71]MDQ8730787.1 MFS transporter [Bradyrhizobium sp. LHD-71]
MCVGQVGNLLPHVVVPAIMAQHLMSPWQLSGGEAGLMASGYAFGYMLAVPVLATLTDRIDARLILLCGSALSALATVAFGLFAVGLWSATALWSIAGIGFAGAYMPGLKALTDRLPAGDTSRAVTLYTSSFSFGVGLSFLVSQLAADAFGWRSAFFITGIGPLAMLAACVLMPPHKPAPASAKLLDFRPVLRNRPALGYILGYGAHCFELYGIRTWIVGFWSFVVAQNAGQSLPGAIAVSVLFTVLAMPASILGNEAAIRFGRHRAITIVMVASALIAVAIGLFAGFSPWLLLLLILLYAITVPADSGALTAGMTASADPAFRGATMALHSTVGFGLSAAGAWGLGVALDAAGGPMSTSGWLAAFCVLAIGIALGPLALFWSRPRAA